MIKSAIIGLLAAYAVGVTFHSVGPEEVGPTQECWAPPSCPDNCSDDDMVEWLEQDEPAARIGG